MIIHVYDKDRMYRNPTTNSKLLAPNDLRCAWKWSGSKYYTVISLESIKMEGWY